MTGVLEQLIRPQKKAMHRSDLKAMELQTAKEILAETFGISVQEVEEMILLRCEEKELWPESFSVY